MLTEIYVAVCCHKTTMSLRAVKLKLKLAWEYIHQSGTKPNLVAKILANNFGNLWA